MHLLPSQNQVSTYVVSVKVAGRRMRCNAKPPKSRTKTACLHTRHYRTHDRPRHSRDVHTIHHTLCGAAPSQMTSSASAKQQEIVLSIHSISIHKPYDINHHEAISKNKWEDYLSDEEEEDYAYMMVKRLRADLVNAAASIHHLDRSISKNSIVPSCINSRLNG